ncbi:MAG: hypothetical protein ABL878_12450 [Burkholderiales bacterium]
MNKIGILPVWAALTFPVAAKSGYFPPRDPHREIRVPEAVGVDSADFRAAVRPARDNEIPRARDVLAQIRKDGD